MQARDEATLAGMVADIEEMDRIIGQFLEFARTDRDAALEPCDAVAIVAACVERYARAGRDVRYVPGAAPPVPLRATAYSRLVANLIDNALAYGAPPVEVTTNVAHGKFVLDVADRGPGIAPGDVERLKQPFTRASASRTERRWRRRRRPGPGDRRPHRATPRRHVRSDGARRWRHDRAGGGPARHVRHIQRANRSTVASAAIPSPRPAKPRRSVVVALMLTCATSHARSAAMFARICGTCGASFGACAITVVSRFSTETLRRGKRRDMAQQHAAVGILPARIGVGKCAPMSPSASAPRMASAIAWSSTSASEWPSRPQLVRNRHAAQHEPASRDERVHVEAVADADGHGVPSCVARIAPASARSEGYVTFTFCALPLDEPRPGAGAGRGKRLDRLRFVGGRERARQRECGAQDADSGTSAASAPARCPARSSVRSTRPELRGILALQRVGGRDGEQPADRVVARARP